MKNEMLIEEIKKLIVELNTASKLYYNGFNSTMSDIEYDTKFNRLKELERITKIIYSNSPTQNVGSPVLSELKKIKIKNKPMLSLDKVHTAKEIIDFSKNEILTATVKCDGLSVRIIYKDGKIFSANTRGDGYEGGNITQHIKYFLNVPLEIPYKDEYIIDGEAIIYDEDFKIINKKNNFKNNRNTASGALSLLDMSVVKERRLSFIAWDIIKGPDSISYSSNLLEASHYGFSIVPFYDCIDIKENKIDSINNELLKTAKEKGIPCDGVVWKITNNNRGNERGSTSHHFLNAVAWKSNDIEYETELLDIEWSLGRTGQITPIALFKKINIDETEINRASLNNLSILYKTLGKKPFKGQTIMVTKRNQIIPKVERAKDENGQWI